MSLALDRATMGTDSSTGVFSILALAHHAFMCLGVLVCVCACVNVSQCSEDYMSCDVVEMYSPCVVILYQEQNATFSPLFGSRPSLAQPVQSFQWFLA